MALVHCKECRTEVSDAAPTCPRCGVTNPGRGEPSKLIVTRKASATGLMYSIQLIVDGKPVGELKSGARFSVDLSAGTHSVQVAGGGLSKAVTITAPKGATVRYETYFSNWGILGGGLNLRPE